MALQRRAQVVDPLSDLLTQFTELQGELRQLETKYQTLGARYGKECSTSLRGALKDLFQLIKNVNKADKTLVNWHHRSNGLKVALRVCGVDRRAQTILDKKTNKLKSEVAIVEQKFTETRRVFHNGINAVEGLNEDFKRFSTSSVGSTSSHARLVSDQYEVECRRVKDSIVAREEEGDRIQLEAATIHTDFRNVTAEREGAESSRDVYATGSTMSYIAAGTAIAGAFFFTPVLLAAAAGGLAIAGNSAASAANEFDAQAQELQERERELAVRISRVGNEVESLKQQLSIFERQRSEYTHANEMAKSIQQMAVALRGEAHGILADLRQASMSLVSTQEKVSRIAKELRESGYAKSRREIAIRLRETLNLVQFVGTRRNMVLDQMEVNKAVANLAEIEGQTWYVLQLMEGIDPLRSKVL